MILPGEACNAPPLAVTPAEAGGGAGQRCDCEPACAIAWHPCRSYPKPTSQTRGGGEPSPRGSRQTGCPCRPRPRPRPGGGSLCGAPLSSEPELRSPKPAILMWVGAVGRGQGRALVGGGCGRAVSLKKGRSAGAYTACLEHPSLNARHPRPPPPRRTTPLTRASRRARRAQPRRRAARCAAPPGRGRARAPPQRRSAPRCAPRRPTRRRGT
jgi:hypothetical protein